MWADGRLHPGGRRRIGGPHIHDAGIAVVRRWPAGRPERPCEHRVNATRVGGIEPQDDPAAVTVANRIVRRRSGSSRTGKEVLAYAAEEAEDRGQRGSCSVTIHANGSISVADDGRGTDTRRDEDGVPIKKPVIATKDLRFFDAPDPVCLPDGQPRRGMSVVAALSRWLIHTNRRQDGAWTQRYKFGIPCSDLVSIPPAAATGTTIQFLVDQDILPAPPPDADRTQAVADFPWLCIQFRTG